jgi:pilus assembly protein CpaC
MRLSAGKLLEIGFALSLLAAPAAFAGSNQAAREDAAIGQQAQNAPPAVMDQNAGQDQSGVPPIVQPAAPPPPSEIPKPFHGSVSFEAGSGKILTLTLPAANIYVADPKVAEVRPASSTSLFVFGVGAGHTTIAAVDLLGRLLADYEVTVRPSMYGAHEAQSVINRLIPGGQIQVRPQGKGLMLTGGVASAADAEQAMTIAKGYATADGGVVENQMSITSPSQVTLMVRIAEMKRSIARTIGLNWDGAGFFGKVAGAGGNLFGLGYGAAVCAGIQAGIAPAGTRGPCTDAILNALAKDGLAHILAEPNLTVMSGQSASFHSGGEYPILVASNAGGVSTIAVTYKPYGVILSFVPTVLSSGRINLHVRPEVSELDTTNTALTTTTGSTNTVTPYTTVRRAETTVELGSGESFAIAGMLQTINGDADSGVPGLGDTPILGALFKANNLTREQTELVIIVTPLLVHPVRNVAQLQIPADGYKPLGDVDRLLWNKQVPNADGTVTPKGAGQAGFIVR